MPWHAATVVLLSVALVAQARQEFVFRQRTPMGGDALILMPAKKRLQLMATLESKDLEGVRQVREGDDEYLRAPDGGQYEFYPPELKFRFSIGQRLTFIEKNPLRIETKQSPDEFQSNLSFQLKLFRGLHTEIIKPDEARMIGVPKEIPYDERIYSVVFKLPRRIPARERMRLEVYDSKGTQIAKFQVQLL